MGPDDSTSQNRPEQIRSGTMNQHDRPARRLQMDERESTGGVSPVMQRTAVFLLAGAGMLVLGAAVQPRFKTAKVESEEQRVLFPELSDASKAASLEIVSYDDELSTLHPFKVMQSGGVWVLLV